MASGPPEGGHPPFQVTCSFLERNLHALSRKRLFLELLSDTM